MSMCRAEAQRARRSAASQYRPARSPAAPRSRDIVSRRGRPTDSIMTAPIRPVPPNVDRWITFALRLRWCDAAVAWVIVWALLAAVTGLSPLRLAVLSLVLVALASRIRPVRVLWRPVSGAVGLAVSRDLRAGDRAWYVRSQQADLVLVTARHGSRVVIAAPDLDEPDEVLTVRRTRVLLFPALGPRPT